jgi:hypothetical protein
MSPTDFWVAFDGELWHSGDAQEWSPFEIALDVVHGVFGSDPENVWVHGRDATGPMLLHWDGQAWAANIDFRPVLPPDPSEPFDAHGLIGSGCSIDADDVWVHGRLDENNDALLHWDGSEWTRDPAEMYVDSWRLTPVCRGSDAWLHESTDSEQTHYLHRRVGAEWTDVEIPEAAVEHTEITFAVGAAGGGEAWLAGYADLSTDIPHIWHVTPDGVVDTWAEGLNAHCRVEFENYDCAFAAPWSTDAGRTFVVLGSGTILEHIE